MKKIATVLLTLLLIAGAVFGVCYYVGLHAFSVTYKGEQITEGLTGISLSGAEPLDLLISGEYTYKVIPCESDFRFTDNGATRALTEFDDFTAGFRFEEKDGHLIMTPVGGLSSVITAVTGRPAIVGDYNLDLDLFTLVIQSADGTEVRNISFGLYRYEVEGVKLSREVIEF